MDMMKLSEIYHEIARIEFQFYKPGAKITSVAMNKRFAGSPYNCFWYPGSTIPHVEITGTTIFDKPAVFVRVTAIGISNDCVATGELDFLMSMKGAERIMGAAIQPLYEDAVKTTDDIKDWGCKVYLAAFAIEPDNAKARPMLIGQIRMDQIERLI